MPTLQEKITGWFFPDNFGDIDRPAEGWELILDLARDSIDRPYAHWSNVLSGETPMSAGERLGIEIGMLAESTRKVMVDEGDSEMLEQILRAIVLDFARRERDRAALPGTPEDAESGTHPNDSKGT